MKTASLTILERSELPPAQARAILEVMEAEIVSRDGLLATKGDLRELSLATKRDLQELSAKMDVNFAIARGETRSEIAAMEGKMIRWVFAVWVAQLGVIVGLVKLLK